MSFQGKARVRCPSGCDPRDVQIWSFVNGGEDSLLRESLLAGDLNLISCEECGAIFHPEATVVYYDAEAEILAFVLPESYRSEEALWRKKMDEDHVQMRKILPQDGLISVEPRIYFGMDLLRQELAEEDALGAQVQIARLLCKNEKLTPYLVERSFARPKNLPWILPCRGSASLGSAKQGVKAILAINDRLEGYRRWQEVLTSLKALPPGTSRGSRS